MPSFSSGRPRTALIYGGLYCFCLAILLALAGPRLSKPSSNNHFSHQALAWLSGRLDHGGPPPGYCSTEDRKAKRCRGHRYDDWVRIYELEHPPEHPGEDQLLGVPCRSKPCKALRREQGKERWWILGKGWQDYPRRTLKRGESRWYISFPPGPAMLMLLLVAGVGDVINDVWLTCLVGACIPCLALALLLRLGGLATTAQGPLRQQVYLIVCAISALFATPTLLLASHGRVWFTAQVVAITSLLAALLAHESRRPLLAGFCFAFAFASRPLMLLACPIFIYTWWRSERSPRWALRFVAFPLLMGLALMVLNYLRFASVFEFGHNFLDVRWLARIQEHGLFSTEYLSRNLQCLFTLLPQAGPQFPYLKFSIHGSALWLGCPWLLGLSLLALRHGPHQAPSQLQLEFPRGRMIAFCLCAAAIALPALFYQNSGQLQVSYRFASDWAALVLVVGSLAFAQRSPKLRGLWLTLLICAACFQLWTAYAFGRVPGQLFVTDPMGWPFEHELR